MGKVRDLAESINRAYDRYRHDPRNQNKDDLARLCAQYADLMIASRKGLSDADELSSYLLVVVARAIDSFATSAQNNTRRDFSLYLYDHVRGGIRRYRRDDESVIPIPAYLYEVMPKVLRFEESFQKENFRAPTPEEGAHALGVTVACYIRAKESKYTRQVFSIDQPAPRSEESIVESLVIPVELSVDHIANHFLLQEIVAEYMRVLNKKISFAHFLRRYGFDPKQQHLGLRSTLDALIQENQCTA